MYYNDSNNNKSIILSNVGTPRREGPPTPPGGRVIVIVIVIVVVVVIGIGIGIVIVIVIVIVRVIVEDLLAMGPPRPPTLARGGEAATLPSTELM